MDILDAWELLVNAGADNGDCVMLLEQSAKLSNVELVKRLLDRGLRLPEIKFWVGKTGQRYRWEISALESWL